MQRKKSRKLTRKEKRVRIERAIEEIMRESGLLNQREIKNAMKDALRPTSLDDIGPQLFYAAVSSHFQALLRKVDKWDATEEEFEAELSKLKTFGEKIPGIIRKGFSEMKHNLPRHGGPGRTKLLSRKQQLDVVDDISRTHRTSPKLRYEDIFKAVAESFKAKGFQISERTIKRIWLKRGELYSD